MAHTPALEHSALRFEPGSPNKENHLEVRPTPSQVGRWQGGLLPRQIPAWPNLSCKHSEGLWVLPWDVHCWWHLPPGFCHYLQLLQDTGDPGHQPGTPCWLICFALYLLSLLSPPMHVPWRGQGRPCRLRSGGVTSPGSPDLRRVVSLAHWLDSLRQPVGPP